MTFYVAEAAGGSLRYGILVLSLSLPQRKRTGAGHRKVTASKTIRRSVIPREFLDEVRSLRNEVCGHCLPIESDDESILRDVEYLEGPVDSEEEPDTFSNGTRLDNIPTRRESPLRARFGLMGSKYRDRKQGPRKAVTIRHCTISFTMTEVPADGFWEGRVVTCRTEAPHAWASEVQDQDPGARLAFRVYLKDKLGQLILPVVPGSHAVKRTASWMHSRRRLLQYLSTTSTLTRGIKG